MTVVQIELTRNQITTLIAGLDRLVSEWEKDKLNYELELEEVGHQDDIDYLERRIEEAEGMRKRYEELSDFIVEKTKK